MNHRGVTFILFVVSSIYSKSSHLNGNVLNNELISCECNILTISNKKNINSNPLNNSRLILGSNKPYLSTLEGV